MPKSRRMQRLCATTSGADDLWRTLYGTDNTGNFPQWKKDQHEGHCWHPCPYSTQCDALRTRHLLGLEDYDALPTQADHSDTDGKVYYMQTAYRGQWGYECTYDQCPYYLDNGERYFYT
jgi:hypothetical protein